MLGSVSMSPGLHIRDFEAGEVQAFLDLFLLQVFIIHLGEKGEAVLGGVGLWGQHCTHTHRHTPPSQARGMQKAQGCDGVQGLCHSPYWQAEWGDMAILELEGLQSSPMLFIHLHACLFGLKFIALDAEKPKRCGQAWLQSVAVPWEMLGLTGDDPGLSAASGQGSLLGSHKGFFLLRK